MSKNGFPAAIDPNKERDVVEAFKAGLSNKEVSELTGMEYATVTYLKKKAGLSVPKKRNNQDQIESLKEVSGEIEELERKLAELKAMQDKLQIRFDHDNQLISVYGIIGPDTPVTTTIQNWLRFFKNDGPSRLREYIEGVKA